MAKKNPTKNNIRQGHTLYVVSLNWYIPQETFIIVKYLLYSHNEPIPPIGNVIQNMPVSRAREIMARNINQKFYFSRKKALTAQKNMQAEFDNRKE